MHSATLLKRSVETYRFWAITSAPVRRNFHASFKKHSAFRFLVAYQIRSDSITQYLDAIQSVRRRIIKKPAAKQNDSTHLPDTKYGD